MTLRTLKPKLATLNTSKVPMLNAKAGTTEMERGRAWMAKRAIPIGAAHERT